MSPHSVGEFAGHPFKVLNQLGTIRDGGTSKHLGAGDGHIDIDATFKTLKGGGFRGWVMVDTWQIPDPYDASTKGLAAIRRGMSA